MAGMESTLGEASEGVHRLALDEPGNHLDALERELGEGHTVELVREGRVVGEVRQPVSAQWRPLDRRELPDFMARMKEIWGDKVLPSGTGARLVREDRDARG